jgi:hypothetical protein
MVSRDGFHNVSARHGRLRYPPDEIRLVVMMLRGYARRERQVKKKSCLNSKAAFGIVFAQYQRGRRRMLRLQQETGSRQLIAWAACRLSRCNSNRHCAGTNGGCRIERRASVADGRRPYEKAVRPRKDEPLGRLGAALLHDHIGILDQLAPLRRRYSRTA